MTHSTTDTIRFGRLAPTLAVTDMATARAFYIDALGFEVRFENGDPVGFIVLRRDEAELHLTLHPEFKPATFNVAHLLVDGVDALHSIVQAKGCRIVKGIRDKDFGLRAFVFEDPFGNRIDVGQPIL